MPKTFIELWDEYCKSTNPVTRWSLRECLQLMISREYFSYIKKDGA